MLRVLGARRGQRTEGPLILVRCRASRSTGEMATGWSPGSRKSPESPRHISPRSLRRAASANALDAGCGDYSAREHEI